MLTTKRGHRRCKHSCGGGLGGGAHGLDGRADLLEVPWDDAGAEQARHAIEEHCDLVPCRGMISTDDSHQVLVKGPGLVLGTWTSKLGGPGMIISASMADPLEDPAGVALLSALIRDYV